MKRLSRTEFLALFDGEIHDDLRTSLQAYPDTTALVLAVNHNMSSSRLGECTAICVGPSNTYTSVEDCEGKWIGDLPSMRQYFVSYITREDFLAD